MCVQDIVIARNCYIKRTVVDANSAANFAPNPDRLIIQAGQKSSQGVFLALYFTFAGEDDANGRTIAINESFLPNPLTAYSNHGYINLNYRDHGPIVWEGIRVVTTGNAALVLEVIMDPALAGRVRDESAALHKGMPQLR